MAVSAYVPGMDDPAKRPLTGVHRLAVTSPLNVALLGFGTVGQAVADILCRTPQTHLRLTHVFNRDAERKRASWVPEHVHWTSNFYEILGSKVDVVIELMGGQNPACDFIRQALLSGKSVVTANKHVMARHGAELLHLAAQAGQRLEYGASVGGAVPILPSLQYGLAGDRLFRISGILNGTCNYILSNMEAHGTSLSTALVSAQKFGYAEKDASDDIHGLDAACKLAILVRLAFHTDLDPFEIPRNSITEIEPADFHFARQLGCTIRQISYAALDGSTLHAAVGPALVPLTSPLARTCDNQNAVVLTGERTGETLLSGSGAGGSPTAVAVVSDLQALMQVRNSLSPGVPVLETCALQAPSRAHYLRFRYSNPDLLAATRILDEHRIAIDKVLKPADERIQEIAFVVQNCSPLILRKAARQISASKASRVRHICPLFADVAGTQTPTLILNQTSSESEFRKSTAEQATAD